MKNFNEVFSNNLKEKRKKLGMTQQDLADKMNTSKQVISRYENGLNTPNVETAYEMAKVLDVDINFLLGDNSNLEEVSKKLFKEVFDEFKNEIRETLMKLDPDGTDV